MSNESTNKLICRKCGGPHFTIKCGKDKIEPIKELEKKPLEITPLNIKPKEFIPNRREKNYSRITYRVKLSELPRDMNDEEMMELTSEWGHIVKIRVINYDENSVAYIDFGFEDEAIYFVEAIDKTPFDSLLLSATRVESY